MPPSLGALPRGDRGDFRNEPIFIVKQCVKPYLDVALGWGREKWEEGKIRAEEQDLWKGLGTTENNGG